MLAPSLRSLTGPAPHRPVPGPASPEPGSRAFAGAVASALGHAARLIERAAPHRQNLAPVSPTLSRALASLADRPDWPVRPLRIGAALDPRLARRLAGVAPNDAAEWFLFPPDADAPRLADRAFLDAFINPAPGTPGAIVAHTSARAGRAPALGDWADPAGISYLSVFPARLDPARVTLAAPADDSDAPLGRALIHAAAALARHPARLSLADRLFGRRLPAPRPTPESILAAPGFDPLGSALAALADAIPAHPRADATARVASRVATAGLVALADDTPDRERRRLMERAAAPAIDEPDVLLRLAAARFADLDDDAGLDALLRADRALRAVRFAGAPDPLTCLQSQLEHGTDSSMTIGRSAAALALVAAAHDQRRLDALRDDLADDMRFCGWLVGRDQDRALLLRVFRELEKARNATLRDASRRAA